MNVNMADFVLYIIFTTYLSILGVTLYLHRSIAHNAVVFHPFVANFFRIWLWLSTGMRTIEWVAVHRKHHAFSDKPGDPHSPWIFGDGPFSFLAKGVFYYRKAVQKMQKNGEIYIYGKTHSPNDYLEIVFERNKNLGIFILLFFDVLFFGWGYGVLAWIIQMVWIPLFAAGVINGWGHMLGYRNFDTKERSRNIFPIAILIGGEELHNNHHKYPASAKFSQKWFEIDAGWFFIKIFCFLKLAKVNVRSLK